MRLPVLWITAVCVASTLQRNEHLSELQLLQQKLYLMELQVREKLRCFLEMMDKGEGAMARECFRQSRQLQAHVLAIKTEIEVALAQHHSSDPPK